MKPEYKQVSVPPMRFTCFHCLQTFSDTAAKEHFGINSGSAPACQLRAAQVAILRVAAEKVYCIDDLRMLTRMADELEKS